MDNTQKKLTVQGKLYIASAILFIACTIAVLWHLYTSVITNTAQLQYVDINITSLEATNKQLQHSQLQHIQRLDTIAKQLAMKASSQLLHWQSSLYLFNLANHHLLIYNYPYALSILKKALITINDKTTRQYINAAINKLSSHHLTDSSITLAKINNYLDILAQRYQPQPDEVMANPYLAKIQKLFANVVTIKKSTNKGIDGHIKQIRIQLYMLQLAILTYKPALYASSTQYLLTLLEYQTNDLAFNGLKSLVQTIASQPLTTIAVDLTAAIRYLQQQINLISSQDQDKQHMMSNILPHANNQADKI